MYNSIIFSCLNVIWDNIVIGYEYSLLKKTIRLIKSKTSFIFKGSSIINFFISDRSLLEESSLYRIYNKFVNFISETLKLINQWIKKLTGNSFIFQASNKLFYTENTMFNGLLVFIMAFAIGIIANNILRGYYWGRSFIVSIILIIVSLAGLVSNLDINNVVKNSIVSRFVGSIFTIDEEVDRWW